MRYIRQVHVDQPGTSNEHISQLRSSTTPTGTLAAETRAEVAGKIERGVDSYRSHSDATGAEAPVVAKISSRGTHYVATIADGRETNNLLNLPRF